MRQVAEADRCRTTQVRLSYIDIQLSRGLYMAKNQLGERLREARIQANLTQEQVADYLKVRRPAIAEIEAGTRAVKSDELIRLTELYGKTLRWILEGVETREDRIAAALFRADQPPDPLLRREAARLARRCHVMARLEEQLGAVQHHGALPTYSNEVGLNDYSQATEHGRQV